MPIITKEKLPKPRILLLDFSDKLADFLRDEGYFVSSGKSGLSGDDKLEILAHHSEVELVFWNFDKVSRINGAWSWTQKRINVVKQYFDRVERKGGIFTIILGNKKVDSDIFRSVTKDAITIDKRSTTTVCPDEIEEDEDDESLLALEKFIDKSTLEKNLNFYMRSNVNSNKPFQGYYSDEDNHYYVGRTGGIMVFFAFSKTKAAILQLLQDVYPKMCRGDQIFPGLDGYLWLNRSDYLPSSIKDELLKTKILEEDYQKAMKLQQKIIEEQNEKFQFLSQSLIADNKNFEPPNDLQTQVKKMLEHISFKVEDCDAKNTELGIALKEDLQIQEDDFIALVEVKGTELGAKVNWVKKNLLGHRSEYCAVNEIDNSLSVYGILVFNHERRTPPLDRKEPYSNDPSFLKYCEKMNIVLVPIYELFKICVDVSTGALTKEKARLQLEKPGLLKYST